MRDSGELDIASRPPPTLYLPDLFADRPKEPNWGWYQNADVDKLGAEVMQTFDDVEQTKILQRLHEIAVEEAARIFIVHDLNPRALSPRVIGFVQARSWYQDLTPIVVTSPPN